MFNPMEGDAVVLRRLGTYSQSQLFEFHGKLFAKTGNSFVLLRSNGTTTRDNTNFVYIETEKAVFIDKFGRLTLLRKGNNARFSVDGFNREFLEM